MSGELSTKSIKFCVLRSESGLNAGEPNKLFLAANLAGKDRRRRRRKENMSNSFPRVGSEVRMMKMSILRYWLRRSHRFFDSGFTIVELLIVIMIIGIAAMISVPIMSSGGNIQIRSAANMIAADLEYAKSIAITRQENFSVSFDSNNDFYEVQDTNGVVILHPVSKRSYRIDFPNDERLSRVGIDVPSFTVTFDSLGSPSSGGVVNLSLKGSGGGTITQVMIEPVTGFVSISE